MLNSDISYSSYTYHFISFYFGDIYSVGPIVKRVWNWTCQGRWNFLSLFLSFLISGTCDDAPDLYITTFIPSLQPIKACQFVNLDRFLVTKTKFTVFFEALHSQFLSSRWPCSNANGYEATTIRRPKNAIDVGPTNRPTDRIDTHSQLHS